MLSQEESIISYLRLNRTGTRREIARYLGCSTVRVGQIVESPLENRFIIQKPQLSNTRGRRAASLFLSDTVQLPVLDMTGDVFTLKIMTLSGKCVAERPFLRNQYFTREENVAAFIRTAALYLKRHLTDFSFPCASIMLPFAYHEKTFSDYCFVDFIIQQIRARLPNWTTVLCTDAEAGAAALSSRPMPHPDALIVINDERAFAAFPDERVPIDLSNYSCNGKKLPTCFAENDGNTLSMFFEHASLFLSAESFLVDMKPSTSRKTMPLLCPLSNAASFYAYGASLLLLQKLIITASHRKGDT